jgi:hypothetical protein
MNLATTEAPLAGEQLERRLEELLHQDRFEASPQFVAGERVNWRSSPTNRG